MMSFIWDKTPAYIKWPMFGFLVLLWTPIMVREKAANFVDGRVWAIITPLKEKRELELFQYKREQDIIAKDVRDIRNYLLFKKKPELNEP